MATKSAQQEPEKLDIEEALDVIDKTVDRVKSLYEQYFLGIQKQAPTFLHTDLERKLRDLSQVQIRNTALRYRFVTLQQKFGSYHAYWRRTIRQIENGTYGRSLHKLGRKAALTGEEIPEEILAAMPKRMREQVRRDREAALALAQRRNQLGDQPQGEGDFYDEYDRSAQPAARVDARGAHVLDEADADLDLDQYFRQVEDETAEPTHAGAPPRPEHSELDQFENIITPPRATPTPPAPTPTQPSAPAPLRAATLGFGPRPTTSPNLRAVTRGGTDPGAAGTPPSFRPTGSATGSAPTPPAGTAPTPPGSAPTPRSSRPVFRNADTVPGTGPPTPGRNATEPGVPPAPTPQPFRPPAMAGSPARPAAGQSGPGQTGPVPLVRPVGPPGQTGPVPVVGQPGQPRPLPAIPQPKRNQPMTEPDQQVVGAKPLGRAGTQPANVAPSQDTRPNPVPAGAASAVKPTPVETLTGPFRRTKRDTDLDHGASVDVPMEPTPRPQEPVGRPAGAAPSRPTPVPPARPTPRPGAPSPSNPNQARAGSNPAGPPSRPSQPAKRPPPGMTDDDVNALYAKYVKAKEMVGETTGPQTYGKLLNTINAQAPKIMEQYKAKGVDFSVVVKDNQVIIRAKPKP